MVSIKSLAAHSGKVFSAKIEGSKGGHITSAEVFVERPVSRSDFSFQQDGLSGFDGPRYDSVHL